MRALTGTGRLLRLALRRDRILLPTWLISLGGLTAALVASVAGLYGSEAERAAGVAFGAGNVVSRVFDGAASGIEPGAVTMVQVYMTVAVLTALMSAQAVVRHTRLEEETGRAEMVGSGVVGRHARLIAALILAAGAALAVGALVTVVLLGQGLQVRGSIVAGGTIGAAGAVFAGVAAVTSQVSATARGANAAAGAVLAAAFLLRAIGDAMGTVTAGGVEVISAWPSWLSPLGWGQQARPFHQDNIEAFWLSAVLVLGLMALAGWLSGLRDVGAGMVSPRPAPARGTAALSTPLGLAWRLQRGVLAGWAVGLAILGAAFGLVGESAEEVIGLSAELEASMRSLAPEGDLVAQYFTLIVGFLGIAAATYTVQAVLRMRSEEARGRLEPVLATATARHRWLASHVVIALAGTVGLLLLLGLSGTAAYGLQTGRWAAGAEGLLGGALLQAPAALALGAFVVLAFAFLPRQVVVVGWCALAVSLVMGQLGALLQLPQVVLNVSPFTHVTGAASQVQAVAPLALLGVTVGLVTLATVAFRRRDLATSP